MGEMDSGWIVWLIVMHGLATEVVGSGEGAAVEGLEEYEDYVGGEEGPSGNGTEATTAAGDEGFLRMTRGLFNLTKASGEAVKLRCEATGEPPPTKFEWLKYGAPVVEERNRLVARPYKIKGKGEESSLGTRLKILALDVHDTGFYTCQISNGVKTVESTGVLKVRVGGANRPLELPAFPHFHDLFDGEKREKVGKSP